MTEELPMMMIPSEKRPDDTRFAKLRFAERIPKPPFTYLAVAPIGQGKSSMIYTMLADWYANYFDEIIVYNGTKDSNQAWIKLPAKEVVLLNEWDEKDFFDYIKALEDSQLRRINEGKAPINVCIVFDDMITDAIFSRGRSTALDQFIIKIRHIPASLIMSSQSYKLVSTTARRNMTHIAILPVNQDEIEKVAEEHSGLQSRDDFVRMYKGIVTKKPRNFLVIDYRAPIEERFKERFDHVIPYLKKSTETISTKRNK